MNGANSATTGRQPANVPVEIQAGVATVMLDRPDKLNTLDLPTLEALIGALERVAGDPGVFCVILGGRGRAFCAGADIGEMAERGPGEWERIVQRYLVPVRLLAGMAKPTIARLHGDTVGGGLGLALACDFRIARPDIRLGAPFVKLGLAGCDMSAGYFLPRLVGLGRALDLMMTGRLIDGVEAERIGLVTRLARAQELDGEVAALAGQLAAGAPIALAYTKGATRRSADRDMEAEFDYEVLAQVQCLQTADHREGVAAFRERREPRFQGR